MEIAVKLFFTSNQSYRKRTVSFLAEAEYPSMSRSDFRVCPSEKASNILHLTNLYL